MINVNPPALAPTWAPDVLAGCEATTLVLPSSYDGPCVATLVRRLPAQPTDRAVLYIHGYGDYFFQRHMAEAYNDHGYAFYALDLRRYGRSLRPHQLPNSCRDLREYYTEIDRAIAIIRAAHPGFLLLNGHSTGGLTSALYAHEGALRNELDALFLNSPFVELNVGPALRTFGAVLVGIGAVAPNLATPNLLSPLYAQSIHQDYHGEWAFDQRWKPIEGFPVYAGWTRAIRRGQRRLQAGLAVACPVLLMHSARSHTGTAWSDAFTNTDCVLNVEHMKRYGPRIGPNVTLVAIDGGLHDLVLSPPPVREHVFAELFSWLESYVEAKHQLR
jgi:alpha-beta hydrolase superfamily lysophospholipase